MFDVFVAPLHCPVCGADAPDAEIQTYILRDGAAIRLGSELDAVYLTTKNLLSADYLLVAEEPAVGEPIRILDMWVCPSCADQWAMIEIVDRRVREIAAVTLDRATLLSAHFISDTNANILADSLRVESDSGLDSVEVLKRRLL